MLNLSAYSTSSSSPEVLEETKVPIEWPNEQGLDILEYEDVFDFGIRGIRARNVLDFSDWSEDSPADGELITSIDETESTWRSQLELATGDDATQELYISNTIEVGSGENEGFFEAHLSIKVQSRSGIVTPPTTEESVESDAAPSQFTYSFFLDFI
ncbi:hypothetical protein [Salipiger mangrovisoli]|uniref:Uncharacterized protein n=1 Tax=Salipiger mangrovisoli TaxID=2865933 RepID=A0ABR9WY34_9RHOB|nr:hypothetical protein [Salipiger mangrovisoli]MBE9636207.1 hypothetical protein [Salipiger mangrovisoli]